MIHNEIQNPLGPMMRLLVWKTIAWKPHLYLQKCAVPTQVAVTNVLLLPGVSKPSSIASS